MSIAMADTIPIIEAERHDAHARYKMPAVAVAPAKAGKTAISNMLEVCGAIGMHHSLITQFLAYELGSQLNFDKSQRLVVKGQWSREHVQELIYRFIALFVLCQACGLPEHTLLVAGEKPNYAVHSRCAACGFYGPLADAAARHKLSRFIVRVEVQANSSSSGSSAGKRSVSGEDREMLREVFKTRETKERFDQMLARRMKAPIAWHSADTAEARAQRRAEDAEQIERITRLCAWFDYMDDYKHVDMSPREYILAHAREDDHPTHIAGVFFQLQMARDMTDEETCLLLFGMILKGVRYKTARARVRRYTALLGEFTQRIGGFWLVVHLETHCCSWDIEMFRFLLLAMHRRGVVADGDIIMWFEGGFSSEYCRDQVSGLAEVLLM